MSNNAASTKTKTSTKKKQPDPGDGPGPGTATTGDTVAALMFTEHRVAKGARDLGNQLLEDPYGNPDPFLDPKVKTFPPDAPAPKRYRNQSDAGNIGPGYAWTRPQYPYPNLLPGSSPVVFDLKHGFKAVYDLENYIPSSKGQAPRLTASQERQKEAIRESMEVYEEEETEEYLEKEEMPDGTGMINRVGTTKQIPEKRPMANRGGGFYSLGSRCEKCDP